MPMRRAVLRKGGLVGAGTLAGIVALPSPPDAPEIDRSVEGTEPEYELPESIAPWLEGDDPITDKDDAPIARYQFQPKKRGTILDRPGTRELTDDGAVVATSPINVVLVPDADGIERVMDVLEDAGWIRGPEEYTRYAWDREAERYVRQQATAAETYYGTSGRFHVRCWSFEGIVSMQVHEDTGARPNHGIESYERGRRAMESIYTADGWHVVGAVALENDKKPDHDGRATVITEDPT